jgi:hypothetical protein
VHEKETTAQARQKTRKPWALNPVAQEQDWLHEKQQQQEKNSSLDISTGNNRDQKQRRPSRW